MTSGKTFVVFDVLEGRRFLSTTISPLIDPAAGSSSNVVSGYTAAQIRKAYGFDKLSFKDSAGNAIRADGTGQTIAIVVAYDAPTIAADLKVFDAQMGIADPPSFTKLNQTGSTKNLPKADAGWAQEAALDVEWAHAMAPGANIVLVEAKSANLSDLIVAVNTARNLPGVSVVSMSWGGSEFSSEANYDSYFTTPTGHQGVTFVAASGDDGSGAIWPSVSSNVVAVGGTTLNLGSDGTYVSETGWSGSGGGASLYEPVPSYQTAVLSTGSSSSTSATTSYSFYLPWGFGWFAEEATATDPTMDPSRRRGGGGGGGGYYGGGYYGGFGGGGTTSTPTTRSAPDVSYDANPSTGFAVYDSYGSGAGWQVFGGTSAGTPQWAAILAIANQGRVLSGQGTLSGANEALTALYATAGTSAYATTFNDVVSGSSGRSTSASVGYDQVTGLGSPEVDSVVRTLIGPGTTTVTTAIVKPAKAASVAALKRTVGRRFVVSPASQTFNGEIALPAQVESKVKEIDTLPADQNASQTLVTGNAGGNAAGDVGKVFSQVNASLATPAEVRVGENDLKLAKAVDVRPQAANPLSMTRLTGLAQSQQADQGSVERAGVIVTENAAVASTIAASVDGVVDDLPAKLPYAAVAAIFCVAMIGGEGRDDDQRRKVRGQK